MPASDDGTHAGANDRPAAEDAKAVAAPRAAHRKRRMPRARLVVLLVLLATVGLLVGATWDIYVRVVPNTIRRRALDAGVVLTFETLELSRTSVTLRGVTFRLEGTPNVSGKAASAFIELEGFAPRTITIKDADVALVGELPDIASSLSSWWRRHARLSSAGASRVPIHVQGAHVSLRPESGGEVWLSARGGTGSVHAARGDLAMAAVALGTESIGAATLSWEAMGDGSTEMRLGSARFGQAPVSIALPSDWDHRSLRATVAPMPLSHALSALAVEVPEGVTGEVLGELFVTFPSHAPFALGVEARVELRKVALLPDRDPHGLLRDSHAVLVARLETDGRDKPIRTLATVRAALSPEQGERFEAAGEFLLGSTKAGAFEGEARGRIEALVRGVSSKHPRTIDGILLNKDVAIASPVRRADGKSPLELTALSIVTGGLRLSGKGTIQTQGEPIFGATVGGAIPCASILRAAAPQKGAIAKVIGKVVQKVVTGAVSYSAAIQFPLLKPFAGAVRTTFGVGCGILGYRL